ncbi:DUF1761 family protein [Aestuariispira insulae]|uniref:Uncharacterized protein DUF1761 n=1 Tax=Aestuariispira insulae TaxID=1461337 RepID=A0A3D9HWN7_9PROT|nr:DUF1761 family protein [Aestuariispira insulae]RED53829.1 uncharacterized protein DUF1761 [Aestuariispira insulae]
MEEITANINWLAVGIGAAIAYLLGWLWYSPVLFLDRWLDGIGKKKEEAAAPPAIAMMIQAGGTFLLAWLVGITAASNSLFTCLLVVAMVMALMASGGLYAQKKVTAILIEIGYVAVMAAIMIAAQALL